MKLVEAKGAISYVFTEIVPVFEKTNQPSEHEAMWTAIHLLGGLTFTLALPDVSLANKLSAPIMASTAYALKQSYHVYIKPQLPDNCMVTIVADSIFGGITALPFALLTGNPIAIGLGMLQGGVISSLSCYNSNSGNNHDEESSAIATAITVVGELCPNVVYDMIKRQFYYDQQLHFL
jgi:hypothetical protein